MQSRVFKSDALLLLTAMIWGSTFVVQRIGMDHVGPFTFTATRFFLGGLCLLPLLFRRSAPVVKAPLATEVRGIVMAGLLLFAGISFQQVGLMHTTAGKAGFITGLYVVLVPIFGLALGHRSSWHGFAGAALALVGLSVLSLTGDHFSLGQGDGLVVIGAFCWAAHVQVLGYFAPRMDGIKLAFGQFMLCSFLAFLVAFSCETLTSAAIASAAIPICYGGFLSVGVGFTLQIIAQKDAPPAHAAIILSLETVFAALGGWLILHEELGLRMLLGCGLMFAGMMVSQLGQLKAEPQPE